VHLDSDLLPDDMTAFRIEIPAPVAVEGLTIEDLPSDWRATPAPESTQAIGAAWAAHPADRAAVLAVPSVIVPEEWNYLLNPAHREAASWRVTGRRPFTLDPRLL
jgi:RES domain-containing protein